MPLDKILMLLCVILLPVSEWCMVEILQLVLIEFSEILVLFSNKKKQLQDWLISY